MVLLSPLGDAAVRFHELVKSEGTGGAGSGRPAPSTGEIMADSPSPDLAKSLTEAIDALLAHVPDNSLLPYASERRKRFDELDRAVWIAACRLGYEGKLRPASGERGGLGLTHLPGDTFVNGDFMPIGVRWWTNHLLALRALATNIGRPGLVREAEFVYGPAIGRIPQTVAEIEALVQHLRGHLATRKWKQKEKEGRILARAQRVIIYRLIPGMEMIGGVIPFRPMWLKAGDDPVSEEEYSDIFQGKTTFQKLFEKKYVEVQDFLNAAAQWCLDQRPAEPERPADDDASTGRSDGKTTVIGSKPIPKDVLRVILGLPGLKCWREYPAIGSSILPAAEAIQELVQAGFTTEQAKAGLTACIANKHLTRMAGNVPPGSAPPILLEAKPTFLLWVNLLRLDASALEAPAGNAENPARPIMGWPNTIPPVPPTICDLEKPTIRRRAEAAWRAGHTILNAIDAFDAWWNLAKVRYLAKEPFAPETGDAISRDGAAAIRALCGLGARRDVFSDERSPLLQHWPTAPSDMVDVTYYVYFPDGSNDPVRRTIQEHLGWNRQLVEPEVRAFLDDLAMSPDATLKPEAAEEPRFLFKRDGAHYRVRFDGEAAILPDRAGVRYLYELLRRPNVATKATELRGDVKVSPEIVEDKERLRVYRDQLQEIDAHLERARDDNNLSEVGRLEQDRQAILDEVGRLRRTGGKTRLNDPNASARVAVTKAIKGIIERCRTEWNMPRFADHLGKYLDTGGDCSYRPAAPVPGWIF